MWRLAVEGAPPGDKPQTVRVAGRVAPGSKKDTARRSGTVCLAVRREAPGGSVVVGVLCRWICMDVFFLFLIAWSGICWIGYERGGS